MVSRFYVPLVLFTSAVVGCFDFLVANVFFDAFGIVL